MFYLNIEKKIVDLLVDNIKDKQVKSVVNIHRMNTSNAGDLMCAPYLYFNELRGNDFRNIDGLEYLSKNFLNTFSWLKKIRNSNFVLGGGGLLDRSTFNHLIDVLSKLKQKDRKVVLWGVGHNNPTLSVSNKYYEQINSFDLVGVRDYNIKGDNINWVPCVSCMHDAFDKKFDIKRDYGVVEHEHIPILGVNDLNFSTLKNKSKFSDIVKFIGETEVIITNSYHVMYWSILMKRKVLVIPNSSKMTSFKYPVPFLDNVKNYNNKVTKCKVYSESLEDCREKNVLFSKKVFNYLNL